MPHFRGAVPPMITPFLEDGEVDYQGLRKLVRFLKQHVHGLFVTGSYGAGPLMSLPERKRVVETCIEEAGDTIPVAVMVGSTTTRDSVDLAKHAASVGAHSVAAVGPYYYTHTADDLRGFFVDLIDAVSLPVYLYNNPKFQGYAIETSTISDLKKLGLRGLKDATFDILLHATYRRLLADDDFDVVLGTESMWLSAWSLGCQAFIPGLANALPEIVVEMYNASAMGDLDGTRRLQFRVNELRDVMYLARSTQLAVYAMLEIRGIVAASPRRPFQPASEQEKSAIKAALKKMGII